MDNLLIVSLILRRFRNLQFLILPALGGINIHSKPARVVAGLTCYTEFDSIYREMGWWNLGKRF
jgi:hypothetical protein